MIGSLSRQLSERIPTETRAKWTYFLLGCAILLPWSALANATPFSLSRLAGSPFYPTFSSTWSSVYTWTKLVFQFYCTFTLKRSSPSRRIFTSLSVLILILTSLCLSTFVQGTPSTFFVFVLFTAASSGIIASYVCTAVYAIAVVFDEPFLRIVFSGQAAIGVVVSSVQVIGAIIALWSPSPKPVPTANIRNDRPEEVSARIFLGVCAVFLSVVLLAYTWLTKQSFYKSVTGNLEHHRVDEHTRLLSDDERRNPMTQSGSHVYRVLRRNLSFMFSLFYVFAVTLAICPAVTTRVRPVDRGIHPLLFTAFHFLVLDIGDLLGRYACSFPFLLTQSAKKILAMSLLRTLFIPLILASNIERPTLANTSPPFINSDILFMITMLMIGYTNGYVSALALLAVSSVEHNPGLKGRHEDVDITATLGGSFITFGLAVGALSSFGLQTMI